MDADKPLPDMDLHGFNHHWQLGTALHPQIAQIYQISNREQATGLKVGREELRTPHSAFRTPHSQRAPLFPLSLPPGSGIIVPRDTPLVLL